MRFEIGFRALFALLFGQFPIPHGLDIDNGLDIDHSYYLNRISGAKHPLSFGMKKMKVFLLYGMSYYVIQNLDHMHFK